MFCPSCGAAAQSGQRFCGSCGAAMPAQAGANSGGAAAAVPGAANVFAAPPQTAAPTPTQPSASSDRTETLSIVEQTIPIPTAAPYGTPGYADQQQAWNPAGVDTSWATQVAAAEPAVAQSTPFHLTPLLMIAIVAAGTGLAALATKLTTTVIDPGTTFSVKLSDIDNALIAFVIGAVLAIGGAALGATGKRFATGLAAGAGLALVGLTAPLIGFVIAVFDSELGSLGTGTFTVTQTREAGFFLLIACLTAGALTFLLALNHSGPDGTPRMNPSLAALGVLASIAAAAGALIPANGMTFGNNFSNDFIPPVTLYLRLLSIALLAVAGIVGFLNGRRWGLGVVLGGISIGIWQMLTTLGDESGNNLGIGGANVVTGEVKPHIVTIVGLATMAVCAVIGLVTVSQSARDRTM